MSTGEQATENRSWGEEEWVDGKLRIAKEMSGEYRRVHGAQ